MKRILTIASLAVGAAVFLTSTASAQYLSRMYFIGRFTYDIQSTVTNQGAIITIYKMKTQALNNKALLDFFNNSPYFTNSVGVIPKGSFFVLNSSNNDIIVTNRNGFSKDLSLSYYSTYYEGNFTPLYINTGTGNSVTSGRFNGTTGQENEDGLAADASINADDGWDDTIAINGLAKFHYRASKVQNGMRNESMSGSITGSGSAWVETKRDSWQSGVVQGKGYVPGGHGKVSVLAVD